MNAQPVDVVMKAFRKWAEGFGVMSVFVAHPITFSYAIVSRCLWKFTGVNPFTDGQSVTVTLDLSSYITGKFDISLEKARRRYLPD